MRWSSMGRCVHRMSTVASDNNTMEIWLLSDVAVVDLGMGCDGRAPANPPPRHVV